MADDSPRRSLFGSGQSLPGAGRKPLVTYALLAVNGLVWLAMEASGSSEDTQTLVDFGALFGPLIANGEYWRLFTAMFLHVGVMHLLFNAFGLFIFGRLVEQVFGHFRFIVIYVIAGLAGSVASFLLNSIAVGAGASGAIFGVLGALAAFFLIRRDVLGEMGRQNLTGLMIIAAFNLFFGFVTPGIDNWAHMGGFVAGFLVGLAFVPDYRPITNVFGAVERVVDVNSMARRWWVFPAVAATLLLGIWLGTNSLSDNPLSRIDKIENLVNDQQYTEALNEIEELIKLDPFIGQAYYLRGKVLAEFGEINGAISELSRALRLGLDQRSFDEARELLVFLGNQR